ncbi:secretory lipase-domain-containing protein [Aspergillus lucknowensis]|uniref:Secretory lipase-domain-containing protein n=1 Tax=Aspergillus lucknowensis TaxID=176173 RepID=A0ABR4LQX0_9EURO
MTQNGVDYAPFDNNLTLSHAITTSGGLNQGWIVTVPDYEGLNAAFMANVQGAYARIPERHPLRFWPPNCKSRAPELGKNIVVAAGGVTPNLILVMETTMYNLSSLTLAALTGVSSAYAELDAFIRRHLVGDPARRKEFEGYFEHCFGWLFQNYDKIGIAEYFDIGIPDIVSSSVVQRVFSENSLGKSAPRIPLLIYHSAKDEVSPPPQVDGLVSWYCAEGSEVEYRRVLSEKHTELGETALFLALEWVKERLDGVPMLPGCWNSTRVSGTTDPGTWVFLGESVVANIVGLLE